MNSKDKSQENQSSQHDQKPNRDPVTGEPRSHPVSTGLGAVGGGVAGGAAGAAAAGAAAGTAAGPAGTVVGAAAGALIGGAAGHAVGEAVNPTRGGDLGRFIDYTVVDRDDDKIGTVDAVWEDHTGQPTYLAVRTGWLGMGKAHVIPAQSAQVNEQRRKIRLPYEASLVKNSPSFDSKDDINENAEFTISEHYGLSRRPVSKQADTNREPRDARVTLKSEDVKVGKREVEYGGVRLRKVVRTETVNRPVELSREEVVVERVPAEGREHRSGAGEKFAGEEVYIPLRREEAVVEKTVRDREQVRVGKKRETEHRDVQETVRREDVEIDRDDGRHPAGHHREEERRDRY
jgi:uncharacterized protein (TIGR02271 family)